jgi:PKD repeat protein
MAKKKRSWLAKLLWPRPERRARPLVPGFRTCTIERLESRSMLSYSPPTLAEVLAERTPNPQPLGDMPADLSQLVTLSTYTEGVVPPDDTGIPEIHDFVVGLEEIYAAIEDNSAARPAYWTENTSIPLQTRMYLDDNGMNITQWTINWGDGSPAQNVSRASWFVHQYSTAGDYTISVTAISLDGTFSDGDDDPSISGSAPTLHVAGPQTVAAGQTFAIDNLASFSSYYAADSFSYAIDWGDGTTPFAGINYVPISPSGSTPLVAALSSDAGDGPLTHVYTDSGTYYVALTVTDDSTGLSDTQTIPVTVVQLVPSITVGGSPVMQDTCSEGDTINFGSSVTVDSSLTDPVAYSWQITDSEGNVDAQGTDPNLSYTFTYADTYTVSLVASVDGVQSAPVTATITVNTVAPSWVVTIPNATINLGQTYNLSAEFTDVNPNDTHAVTVDWGDGSPLDTGAQVNEESPDLSTPGTITDSYTYAATGNYTVTVMLTDSEGVSAPALTFNIDVESPTVALTGFAASSGGSQLQVSYTVTGGTAAPFTIGIYTSPDGVTPDQLLQSVTVDGSSSSLPLGAGNDTASFTPQFDDIQSNYHLIAVSDTSSDTTQSTVEFAGGVFYAQSLTASPPQNILYVFGRDDASDTDVAYIYGSGDTTANTVVINSTDFPYSSITPPITGIHVRGEAASDYFEATKNVTLPLWLFGGSGTNLLVGGSGDNLIVGGSGANTIQSSNGPTTPQTVNYSDTYVSGMVNYFQDSGAWSSPQTVAGAFNGEEIDHAPSSGSDTATWTFGNLDPTAYYDVYVTWASIADASTAAQYSVYDGLPGDGGEQIEPIDQSDISTVDQAEPPFDYLAAGVYWHDLGVFEVTSGTLAVQLGPDGSGEVLANAAMIVPYAPPPLTTLLLNQPGDGFAVDDNGNLTVTYTINGEDSPPFSIGIYQSADGIQPGALAGTIDVSDPGDLTGGGAQHTLVYQGGLNGLDGGQYYLAQLDYNAQVEQTTRANGTSAPLTGVYQDGDGSVYTLFGTDSASHSLTFSQDTSGDVTMNLDGTATTYQNVPEIYVGAYQGSYNIDASGVTAPLTVYCGSGDDTVIGGQGNNQMYGGSGTDVFDGSNGQNNFIQAGSGDATITGGDGNDWLYGGSGTNNIIGGAGTDSPTALLAARGQRA